MGQFNNSIWNTWFWFMKESALSPVQRLCMAKGQLQGQPCSYNPIASWVKFESSVIKTRIASSKSLLSEAVYSISFYLKVGSALARNNQSAHKSFIAHMVRSEIRKLWSVTNLVTSYKLWIITDIPSGLMPRWLYWLLVSRSAELMYVESYAYL